VQDRSLAQIPITAQGEAVPERDRKLPGRLGRALMSGTPVPLTTVFSRAQATKAASRPSERSNPSIVASVASILGNNASGGTKTPISLDVIFDDGRWTVPGSIRLGVFTKVP
jgi:hypothetical protein